MNNLLAALVLATLPFQMSWANAQEPKSAKITLVYEQKIPGMPNKSLKGILVEYGPGAVNPAHTHAKSALIYASVLEGSVLNQLNGGPVRTFTKGQNFTEMPGDRHDVSANASKTEPAKVLAVFVVDTDDTKLTTPIAPGTGK
ncbi:cupin domain-containing protein [Massilia niastensis]|uniref:cupin domain-containing protein n=1 Tax=Massilia niastensis TaxID=544911 RepID=UPI0004765BE9|nr:cupin domain-containing protein [Massilia niastensis]